jgi:REP element-mobilizing transposase RayT
MQTTRPTDLQIYSLNYTCLLIPRQRSRHLNDRSAFILSEQLLKICKLHEWTVTFIKTSPDYLQWGLCVSAATQVSYLMQEIRDGTSNEILSNFEGFKVDSPSYGFWASGYLVVSGTRPQLDEMIAHYIRLVHRQ